MPSIEIVVEPRGTGSRALAALPVGARVAVTGPLGRPFALPREPARCLLVGEGYAAAALTTLAERLRERGCGVRLVLGGADDAHVLEPLAARRSVGQVEVAVGDLTAPVLRSLAGDRRGLRRGLRTDAPVRRAEPWPGWTSPVSSRSSGR